MVVRPGELTFTANAALAPYLRVELSSGKLIAAGALSNELGTLVKRVLAADDPAAVVPRNMAGTVKMVAAGAFSQYATVYGAAGGKIDDTVNANEIGTALEAATADGDVVEVLRMVQLGTLGDIDGTVVIDDDFLGDYPAAATAFDLTQPWIKTETNGLGVIESAEVNGVLKFVFDAVAEAATAALYMTAIPFDIDLNPIFECRLAVFDIGDNAALDINFGLASASHATDFDAIAEFAAFHLDGTDLSVLCHSDDGTTDTAPVDSTVDLVDNTYANFRIDVSDTADVKFYINGVRVCSGTTYDISAGSGPLTPIVHVEKTSDDTTADVRVDRIRVQSDRS